MPDTWRIGRINKDMQLILYSPEYLGLHRISTRTAHIETHHDVVGLPLLLLPRHPLVLDDQEIGESTGFEEYDALYVWLTATHAGSTPI